MNTLAGAIREASLFRLLPAAYRAITVFKFQNKSDADRVEQLLKDEIDAARNKKIKYNRLGNDFSIEKDKEIMFQRIFNRTMIPYKVDEGVARWSSET